VAIVAGLVREVPLVADQDRVTAWTAAVRMWQDQPLIGTGFRTFEWLHADFGSPVLDAPHNEWLRLFAEEGAVVGLAGAAFALLTPLALLRSRGVVADAGVITAAAGAAAAAVFLMAFFNNPFTYLQVNVPAFIVIGTGLGLAIGLRNPARTVTGERQG
jgi:O-antigen ligase